VDRASIALLADHPALTPLVGGWHWDEWGAEDPGGSDESWTQALQAQAGRGDVPSVWLAFLDGAAVGSVTLIESDMDTREDLSPWLGGLYVIPACRRRGVGRRLVRTCESAAATLGYPVLYLHTVSPGYYAALGWVAVSEQHYRGEDVVIMQRDLTLLP
jgi:predicted N-acetyltransferase YhbS